jgi:hypothetical protein
MDIQIAPTGGDWACCKLVKAEKSYWDSFGSENPDGRRGAVLPRLDADAASGKF